MTGAITRLLAEELAHRGRLARIIAVDPSADALHCAQKSLEAMGIRAEFFQGETGDLSTLVQQADAAFFCNAIHLLADKRSAFGYLAAILAPGGILACNSAFFEGTSVEETLRFGRLWIRRAVGWLRKEHPEVQLSREGRAVALQWLTPQEYSSLFKESGFTRVETTQEKMMMSLDGVRDLGHYWLFVQRALPGVPLALGAAALGAAAYQAGQELGMSEIPRLWLQIIATKGE